MLYFRKNKYNIERCRDSFIRSGTHWGTLKNPVEKCEDLIFLDRLRATHVFKNYYFREPQCIANGVNYNVVVLSNIFNDNESNTMKRTTATILLLLQEIFGLEI